jgi:two-component system, OmpR family, KDP operon response regulator KdpE
MISEGFKVLVIDDEVQIRRMLRISLEAFGHVVVDADTASKGVHMLTMENPDIILLDLSLPDSDGKDVVKKIREWSSVPIIILSARDDEEEKITALDFGADDYVTKPFNIGELLARMRVAVRHVSRQRDLFIFTCGQLEIDFTSRTVKLNSEEVKLTPTEYEILKLLSDNAGKVVTHSQILKSVWGYVNMREKHYIRIYIGQLRKKIEKDPSKPLLIVTESGIGYRLICKQNF